MTKRGVKINPLLVLFLAGSAGNSFVNLQGTARCLRFGCLGRSREEEKGRLRGCGVLGPNFLSLLSSGANLIRPTVSLRVQVHQHWRELLTLTSQTLVSRVRVYLH